MAVTASWGSRGELGEGTAGEGHLAPSIRVCKRRPLYSSILQSMALQAPPCEAKNCIAEEKHYIPLYGP